MEEAIASPTTSDVPVAELVVVSLGAGADGAAEAAARPLMERITGRAEAGLFAFDLAAGRVAFFFAGPFGRARDAVFFAAGFRALAADLRAVVREPAVFRYSDADVSRAARSVFRISSRSSRRWSPTRSSG
jgi:hypothetical protein